MTKSCKRCLILNKKYEGKSSFATIYQIGKNFFGMKPGNRNRVIDYNISLSLNKKLDSGTSIKGFYFYTLVKKFEIEIPGGKIQEVKQTFSGVSERKGRHFRAIGSSYWKVGPPEGVSPNSEDMSEGYNVSQNFNFYLNKNGGITVKDYSEQGFIESEVKSINSTAPFSSISKSFRLN